MALTHDGEVYSSCCVVVVVVVVVVVIVLPSIPVQLFTTGTAYRLETA